MEKVLILGASGTVGTAIYKRLSQYSIFDVYGTYFSSNPDDPHMRHFSLDNPERINDILADIAPDIVISALRGDFEKQMDTHIFLAKYLESNHGRLLYFSTANVFDGRLECPHYESDSLQAVSEYGKFKICCENTLRDLLGNSAIILRIPFVYGRNSVRMRQIKDGCKKGALDVYEGLFSNYVTDVQIADYVEWIIREKKEGTFHIGTTDVMSHSDFTKRLIQGAGYKCPEFHYMESAGTMAVLTGRKDIPHRLQWNVERVIAFLCNEEILTVNRSGWSLLKYIDIEESEIDLYDRVTGAYAIVCVKGLYLIGFNSWRKQWEFPAGGIEEGETAREAAERELWEETHQKVSEFQFKGLVKVMAPDGKIRFQAVYLGHKEDLENFTKQVNDEMDRIRLWDLKEDIGYFDECDLKVVELSCL